MDIGPAWTAVLCAAVALAIGTAAGWLAQKRARSRAGQPALVLDGEDILITNMLDEELFLIKIAVNGPFALAFKGDADGQREVEHWFRRSRTCRQTIGPRSEARLQLLLKTNDKPAVVDLTFDSGARTLERKRVRIRIPI